eukprot:PLAT14510.1.p2 GENE.PLAT14510.1~~PLAT14510.1.p2  ORF type:complete len:261 (+),score=95.28 PLAT14510.1:67-783(+)
MSSGSVKFVAVARVEDKEVVAAVTVLPKDPSYDLYLKSVSEVLSAAGVSSVAPRSRRSLNCDPNTFNFVIDEEGRMFIAITDADYPDRLVFAMIDELAETFTKKYGGKSLTAAAGSLNKGATKLFKDILARYDDPASLDKMSRVMERVEEVKGKMADNISTVLATTERMEDLEDKSAALSSSAAVFKGRATNLKRAMRWRALKLKLIMFLVGAVVLGYILIPVIQNASGGGGSSEESG